MANVLGFTRSSYFRVRNAQTFHDWAKEWDIYVEDRGSGSVQIFADFDHGNGCYEWPEAHECDENCDEDCMPTDSSCGVSRQFLVELAKHIEDERIVLLFQAYTERSVIHNAEAIALHSDGRRVKVTLEDAIWKRAAIAFNANTESTLYVDLSNTEAMLSMEEPFKEFVMDNSLDLDDYEASLNRSIDALAQHISAVREHMEKMRQYKVAGLLKR